MTVPLISIEKRQIRNGRDLKMQRQTMNQMDKNGTIIELLRNVMLRRGRIKKRVIESGKNWE